MNCKLIGNVYQALEVTLESNESFYSERSAMIYMDSGIEQEITSSSNGIMGALSSVLSGESLFIVRYTNRDRIPRKLVVSGRSGSLKYLKISAGQNLILKRGDYVASNNKVNIDISLSINKFLTGIGLSFQRITGDSTVFFDSIDTLIERDLQPGEEITVDENHVKALLGINDNQISIQRNTNIMRNLVSGEGFLMTRIVGPGKVFLSTLPSITNKRV
ncbi:AIM24 family protein [Phocaeicola plebeius]|uniref:AIM24 family protein n=1 Tax=Phocaeicola plebeius TaxID=310297 RepID=UPI003569E641